MHMDRGDKSSLNAIDHILIHDCSVVAPRAPRGYLVASRFPSSRRTNVLTSARHVAQTVLSVRRPFARH